MSEQQKAPQERGGFKPYVVSIGFEKTPEFDQAISSLEQLAQVSPESVQLFLDGLDSLVELVRIDMDVCVAVGADQIRALAKPSDRLLNFLSASAALQC